MRVLRCLSREPGTALGVAHYLEASPVAVHSAIQRMRRRGLVAKHTPGDVGRFARLHTVWVAVPNAMRRVVPQNTMVEPPLPPEQPLPEAPRYVPKIVTVGGVAFESYSGRVQLSAYSGASSLVGTARWGCA